MTLREKHAWRRRLGLRGSLWFFEEPKKPKPPSVFNQPAAWSAIVAAISAVITALFAYSNYLFTKQAYLQTHPPKLVAVSITERPEVGKWTYYLTVKNDGETEAINVEGNIQVYDSTAGDHGGMFAVPEKDIAAGRTETLYADSDRQGPEKDGDIVTVLLGYSDRAFSEYNAYSPMHYRRTDKFCGTMMDSTALLSSCEAFLREDLEKSGRRSAKRP